MYSSGNNVQNKTKAENAVVLFIVPNKRGIFIMSDRCCYAAYSILTENGPSV